MKVILNQDFPFIHKKGIRECYIEIENGIYKLTDGTYNQILKKSEYAKMAFAGVEGLSAEEKPKPVETETVNKAPKPTDTPAGSTIIKPGNTFGWIGAKGPNRGKILEVLNKEEKVRIQSDLDGRIFKVPLKALKRV